MTLALAVLLAIQSLDEQTLSRLLESLPGQDETSWLLLDARTDRLIGARWPAPDQPVPIGSLVKPFTALAHGASHQYSYPVHVCSTGCWLDRGHGRIGLVEALAQSCNSYFEQLARETAEEDARWVAARYAFEGPPAGGSLIGRAGGWPAAPLKIARAYCELARRAGEPGVDQVLGGMAASAAHGTAKAVGGGALAKTGTAPCTHARRAPGDGFAIVLFPAKSPKFALLLRIHGAPGSEAARKAGELLRLFREPR